MYGENNTDMSHVWYIIVCTVTRVTVVQWGRTSRICEFSGQVQQVCTANVSRSYKWSAVDLWQRIFLVISNFVFVEED
jgi:hypothetical protein